MSTETVKDESFKESLAKTLSLLSERIDKERKESEPYKDLFKKSENIEGLLRDTQSKMLGVVLDACQVLKEKFEFTQINKEVYNFLKMLPFVTQYMQKEIANIEGNCCCVDKVYYLLSEEILKRRNTKGE